MSPLEIQSIKSRKGAPRASGDEPGYFGFDTETTGCSPRERG